MKKIKNCPYEICQSKNTTVMEGFFKRIFCGGCLDCGARGPASKSKKKAILYWNSIGDIVL